jgi:cytochrome c5
MPLRTVFRPLDWAACRIALMAAVLPVGIEACAGTPAPPPASAPAPTSAPASAPPRTSVPASTSPANTAMTTLSGVYSTEQASRGKDIYVNLCKSCHNPSTGTQFATRWGGKTLFDLFTFIYQNMPDNNPRSVDDVSNADIIGYLMQSAGMPAGTRDVPLSPDSLKAIRIEVKK